MVWDKYPPKYEEVFHDERKKNEPQTDDEMYAMVRKLNALFGGEEV